MSPTQPPSVRQEDVLTSHVFSLFRYLSDLRIPARLLCAALNVEGTRLPVGNLQAAEAFFWPTWRVGASHRRREIDVLLVLGEEGGGSLALGVENKCHSGASDVQGDAEGADGEGPAFTGRQLVDEYVGLQDGQWSPSECARAVAPATCRLLLYVTKHYDVPVRELEEALAILRASPCGRGQSIAELGHRLYWLGWHTIHTLLCEEHRLGYPGYSAGECRLLDDVRGARASESKRLPRVPGSRGGGEVPAALPSISRPRRGAWGLGSVSIAVQKGHHAGGDGRFEQQLRAVGHIDRGVSDRRAKRQGCRLTPTAGTPK